MIKKLILISALLFSFNGWAIGHDVDDFDFLILGSKTCEIKSMGLEGIDQGIPESYSRLAPDEMVGNTLIFEYGIQNYDSTLFKKKKLRLYMDLFNPQNDKHFFWLTKTFEYEFFENVIFDVATFKKGFTEVSFGREFMRMENVSQEFKLKRYNKSDWNGVFFSSLNNSDGVPVTASFIYYFTVDCRQRVDKVNEVLLILKEWDNEKSNEQ